jgi:enoyl-CoA hydratase/carnithine racemase
LELEKFYKVNLPEVLTCKGVHALCESLEQSAELPAGHVLLLLGGASSFCSGLALELLADATARDIEDAARTYLRCLELLEKAPCATMAVVDGVALGGGLGLAASCDVVLASPGARFGLPELVMGLAPALILPVLHRRMGRAQICRWALTGTSYGVADAQEAGLVDDAIPAPSKSLARSKVLEAWRRKLGRGQPKAIVALRRLLSQCHSPEYPEMAQAYLTTSISDPKLQSAWRRFATEGVPPWSDE